MNRDVCILGEVIYFDKVQALLVGSRMDCRKAEAMYDRYISSVLHCKTLDHFLD